MKNIGQCANCNKEINLDADASSGCSACEKDFCFALRSPCFTEYHRKHNLYESHSSLSIANPSWIVNLRSQKD